MQHKRKTLIALSFAVAVLLSTRDRLKSTVT